MADESDERDLRLARAVRNLHREIMPERDLWQGIERRIVEYRQRNFRGWVEYVIPYGVAASLLIAVSALVLSIGRVEPGTSGMTLAESIEQMEVEYARVKNPMVRAFEETNKDLNPDTLQLLYDNIEIIERAKKDIEQALRENPENQKLMEMLMRVHRQELRLLNRDFTMQGRSI